ncbi:ABC transporter ATP-binding protein [Helicobacter sp. 11S02629-2]|uniref:ABC transporter ATP-binding protein n=1 Tax=Helicobacter sp. 11S02629-2 TaxID=1476195 RepID=UPI0015DB2720|nr:ABC transporter ATP-binding protein [Helicobacter sp. 11S02629-2]
MLEFKNFSFSYDKPKKKAKNYLLKNLSFSITPNALTAILAPNGTGKTTLFNVLLGVFDNYEGEILLDSKNLKDYSLKQKAKVLGYIPQHFESPFDFSLLEVVLMGASPNLGSFEVPNKDIKEKALGLLKNLGLGDRLDSKFHSLSGGQRQLGLLARLRLQNAKMLLLDEPSAHLDIANEILFFKNVKKLLESKKTALINIHNPSAVLAFCDYVCMIKDSKILAFGSVKEVMNTTNLSLLYDVPLETFTHNSKTFLDVYKGMC